MFVQDGLAIFAKRLFLAATFIGLLAGLLAAGDRVFARRAAEYHLLILASLLGMLVLASARDLILLFLAFELMSIPLYVLAGFLKREAGAVEASLKFFLVGTRLLGRDGLRAVVRVRRDRHDRPARRSRGRRRGADPLLTLGLVAGAGRLRVQDRRLPVPHVGARHLRGGHHAVRGLAERGAEGGRVRGALPRVLRGRGRPRARRGCRSRRGLATLTIWPATSWRCRSRTPSGCWPTPASPRSATCWSGFAAASASGTAMVLFYLVAYVFGNMGAFLVVEALARAEGSEATTAFRGLAQRSPLLALAMLLFLLSLGGIPFVAGFWAKLYVFWAAAERGLYWLVLLGAVLTVVALFYYLLVAKRMYIEAPERPGSGPRGADAGPVGAALRARRRGPRALSQGASSWPPCGSPRRSSDARLAPSPSAATST